MSGFREEQRMIFLKAAESFINMWYRWGGDDPAGFDCSGSVVAALKACGLLRKGVDLTADGIWHRFHRDYEKDYPKQGTIAFWFNDAGVATHVAICISPNFCITADGGGSFVKTQADAEKHNAFIKYRPIAHRKHKPRYIDPFS